MRLARLVGTVLLAPLAVLVLLEVGLRVEGAVRPRPTDRPPSGSTVVLCAGDSFTRGLLDPDNYPFHLQRLLDERAPGRYRVVNLDNVPSEPALEEVRKHPDVLSVSLIKLPEAGAVPPWLGS